MQIRKNTQDRQKEICLAARKLIVKSGSENVTVRRIAEEIGVSEGAIYRHFKSKSEILSVLIDDIEETLVNELKQIHTGQPDSLEALEKLFLSHISAIEQRKGVTFQVIAEIVSFGDKNLNKKVHNVILSCIASIQNLLEQGIRAGIVKPDINTEAAARMYFSMTQGLVNIWALNQYQFSLIKEFQAILRIYLEAIELRDCEE